jgi:hypothetical protein
MDRRKVCRCPPISADPCPKSSPSRSHDVPIQATSPVGNRIAARRRCDAAEQTASNHHLALFRFPGPAGASPYQPLTANGQPPTLLPRSNVDRPPAFERTNGIAWRRIGNQDPIFVDQLLSSSIEDQEKLYLHVCATERVFAKLTG